MDLRLWPSRSWGPARSGEEREASRDAVCAFPCQEGGGDGLKDAGPVWVLTTLGMSAWGIGGELFGRLKLKARLTVGRTGGAASSSHQRGDGMRTLL